MKNLFFVFTILIFSICIKSSFSQDTVTNTLTNFQIINNGTKFSFDIYTFRNTPENFKMGSSSYYIKFLTGTLNNAVISNINPKYTLGSLTNSYAVMAPLQNYSINLYSRVAIQIFYVGGTGDVISNAPGPNGHGERIATLTMNILQPAQPDLHWDLVNSAVVNPQFVTAKSIYQGHFNEILPVELSSFTSIVSRNNVKLNWVTTHESNNSGFEIERKIRNGNSGWSSLGFVPGNGNSNEERSYEFNDRNLQTGTYNYRLKQIDFNGNFEYHDLQNDVLIGVPEKFELSQNYPNPFNPATKINFSLPEDSRLDLKVYDISGKLIETLVNNEFLTANYYTVVFSGTNIPSGIYFYVLTSAGKMETRKMSLIK